MIEKEKRGGCTSAFFFRLCGGPMPVVMELDRNWENTWYAGIALRRQLGDYYGFSDGFLYDSSPVEDVDRTLDLSMDEIFKLSAAYVWQGKREIDFAVGATLLLAGDARVDQTAQGERIVGEFDSNEILLLGATLRYLF